MSDQPFGKAIFAITNVPFAGTPAVMHNLVFTDSRILGIGIFDSSNKLTTLVDDSLNSQEVLTNPNEITPERLGKNVIFELEYNDVRSVKLYKNFSNTVFSGEFCTLDIYASMLNSNALWISPRIQQDVTSLLKQTPLTAKLMLSM